VYHSVEDCRRNVVGVEGARFNFFRDLAAAQRFVTQYVAADSAHGGAKFYAVARGVQPGVYRSWQECRASIEGVEYPVYKSFLSEDLAMKFVQSGGCSDRFYTVAHGRGRGIFRNIGDFKAQVDGVHKAKFKVCATHAEARAFLAQHPDLGEDVVEVWYAVKYGARTGVFGMYSDYVAAISDTPNHVAKHFPSKLSAQQWLVE
jgi:viroplasmin and RNaseH domain-containing protein